MNVKNIVIVIVPLLLFEPGHREGATTFNKLLGFMGKT